MDVMRRYDYLISFISTRFQAYLGICPKPKIFITKDYPFLRMNWIMVRGQVCVRWMNFPNLESSISLKKLKFRAISIALCLVTGNP